MLIPYIIFFAGFILMIKGGDLFVDAATWLAKITRMPEVLVGATVVSLATTLPEAMVSTMSSLHNETGMAIGNTLGSVICNTALILGICYFIKPNKIRSRIFYIKGIMLLAYLGVYWVLAGDGVIQGFSIMILFAMLALYVLINLSMVKYQKDHEDPNGQKVLFGVKETVFQLFAFVSGAVFILVGAHLLVDYSIIIAEHWGVPSAMIGVTILAFGTSLPELITSVTALRKGHIGLSMGNVLGANILNLTLVTGASAAFNPLQFTRQNLFLDIPVALLVNGILILPTFFTRRIGRFQSFFLVLIYIAYIGFILTYYL